jgi:hypothetical protein
MIILTYVGEQFLKWKYLSQTARDAYHLAYSDKHLSVVGRLAPPLRSF